MNIKIDEIENTQEYLNIKEELEKQIDIYILIIKMLQLKQVMERVLELLVII